MIDEILEAWILPPGVAVVPIDTGLINHTVGIGHHGRLLTVLQRVNTTIFKPPVHHDILAVTNHLAAKGCPTPRLVPTKFGELWHTDPEGGCWRMLTSIGTVTHHGLSSPAQAEQAGALVARFHLATDDLVHDFQFTRPGAHDTEAHLQALRLSLMTQRKHRLFKSVSDVADQVLDGWNAWEPGPELPRRIVHGDLKVSNLRFDDTGEALALIDLDTLAMGTLDLELGDALRSWCNPRGENITEANLRLDLFRGAMRGYQQVRPLSDAERAGVVAGLERICLELSARFARDALEESYFGFDPAYGGRGEHNLLRARGQASLAQSVASQREALLDALTGS